MKMNLVDRYIGELEKQLNAIRTSQKDNIQKAADRIADSIAKGGILHIFGSGHSHMIAEDVFHRAGGLICINAMLEESLMEINVGRTTQLERLNGYASILLNGYDLKAGEVIIIVSNSGMNAVPIEMAMECKARGLYIIVLTNMDHTSTADSRHESGKKLYELADLVLDNCGVYGDAVLSYDQSGKKVGPTSTIGGLIIIQTLMIAIVEELIKRNASPPVLLSANTEGGDKHNKQLIARYYDRIKYLAKPNQNSNESET
ncbi:SIS domain-containing protein [Bacillus sp. SD088]|uniref:SIS domain-containing protein n=1 Tax=Bacillus sp. SD088 TaxID=2782012 RepID=UPI001A97ABF4|nr:SIS domain-containing protein [Bacillus sp. SD088]MBO0991962.1 SIS domain-containing protein [Bacillus sp. SD088]